jgi:LysR family transcriptional regulator, transcriptional activator for bauABCD operon
MRNEPLKRLADADLRLLRIYKTVVEAGGFAAAEVNLGISRAAISMAISDLETRLNLRLCLRGRAGFSVTDEGEQVYQAGLQLFTAIESFRTDVNSLHDQLQGEFNIGITDNLVTMPHMHITNSLGQLKKQGPQVQINISMIPSKRIEQGILDGHLHAGVIVDNHRLPELEYLSLYSEESRLYCSNDHALFLQTNESHIEQQIPTYDAVAPAYAQSAEIKKHYQSLNASATATDREGVAFLILTGAYIGYLPIHFAQQWVDQRRIRELAPKQRCFATNFAVVTRKGRRHNSILDYWLNSLQPTP